MKYRVWAIRKYNMLSDSLKAQALQESDIAGAGRDHDTFGPHVSRRLDANTVEGVGIPTPPIVRVNY